MRGLLFALLILIPFMADFWLSFEAFTVALGSLSAQCQCIFWSFFLAVLTALGFWGPISIATKEKRYIYIFHQV
jgi:hypothetical protein